MKKKYQIFISSTYKDLKEERQAVVEQVLRNGHIPAGMELFRSDDRNQKKLIEEWIKASDVYILILGYRYGSIDEESQLSFTEWEYNLAEQLDKPRIVITLSEKWLEEKVKLGNLKDNETVLPEYKKFKGKLRNSGRYAHEVNNVSELKLEVSQNLNYVIDDFEDKLIGWVSGEYIDEIKGTTEKLKIVEKNLIDRVELKNNKNSLKESTTKKIKSLIGLYENETIMENSMMYTYSTVNDFKNELVELTSSDKIRLNDDAKKPMESFSLFIGRNQIDIRADYLKNKITFTSFIESSNGMITSILARFELSEGGLFVDKMQNFDNKFSKDTIINRLEFFIDLAGTHRNLARRE